MATHGASPKPASILETSMISQLLDSGAVVVAGGGGGIPVAIDESGAVVGVEAVVDKDLARACSRRRSARTCC